MKKEQTKEQYKETNEIEIMKELNEKINALQEENSKLNERLDNCARQFKKMMQTMKELQARVDYLENKQPSTTVEEERKDCAEKKEDIKEVISSPTANDNGSTLTTTHQEEEKPVDCSEMPLNEKKLRYLDTMTNKQYATEAEAQKDGANPWFLYDWKAGRCITEYTSPTSPSNNPNGITTHQEEEKPTVAQQMPSMAIVTDNATPKEEEKAVEEEKKHMYFKEVTTLSDDILNDLKKNYPTSEWPKLFKIDWANHTIVSKTSRDILGYGEASKEVRYRIAMDSKETKRLMKMVGVGV